MLALDHAKQKHNRHRVLGSRVQLARMSLGRSELDLSGRSGGFCLRRSCLASLRNGCSAKIGTAMEVQDRFHWRAGSRTGRQKFLPATVGVP